MPNSTPSNANDPVSPARTDPLAPSRPITPHLDQHCTRHCRTHDLGRVARPITALTSSIENQSQLEPIDGRSPLDAGPSDRITSIVRLDQYYTRSDVAEYLYGVFEDHFDPTLYQLVEPSAGTGSFFRLMPRGSLAYDIEPKYRGIRTADFLTVEIKSERAVAVVGNPPFGKNASMAVRFFNHAARQSSVIAFILPRTFRKASVQNRINPYFHLVYEEELPEDAFLFQDKVCHVPAVFQIWECRGERRRMQDIQNSHPDFAFTTPANADFVVQRVGARAGRIHHDFTASPSSHYFIRGGIEAIMLRLDLATVASNAAGNPSLAKSEIVSLYRDRTESRAG